ncbi:hypothetical protein E2562_009893 [Oryza meyeriana var. granulata]|uniref:Uncharacterized protein n=1 Tax=Oryza meyeriana var. granulata TaxID=110450 RepID=A0A6G1BU11_9ORYZ|nr:hypothetical protein E2562_009893 [Oryza meyeriana var. granulata]
MGRDSGLAEQQPSRAGRRRQLLAECRRAEAADERTAGRRLAARSMENAQLPSLRPVAVLEFAAFSARLAARSMENAHQRALYSSRPRRAFRPRRIAIQRFAQARHAVRRRALRIQVAKRVIISPCRLLSSRCTG